MLAQNVHPKVVQERLGHSTVGITLDTYSHVIAGLQAAALRCEEQLAPQPSPTEGRPLRTTTCERLAKWSAD